MDLIHWAGTIFCTLMAWYVRQLDACLFTTIGFTISIIIKLQLFHITNHLDNYWVQLIVLHQNYTYGIMILIARIWNLWESFLLDENVRKSMLCLFFARIMSWQWKSSLCIRVRISISSTRIVKIVRISRLLKLASFMISKRYFHTKNQKMQLISKDFFMPTTKEYLSWKSTIQKKNPL